MNQFSVGRRLTACLIAGMMIAFCFFRIANRFLHDWLGGMTILVIPILILVACFAYGCRWAFRQQTPVHHSVTILSNWEGLIRYAIALNLSMVGFQKLFGLQFNAHLGALDLPFSQFPLEDLTWAFFGQSRAFACIIGAIQILGSFLLLFHRTRLTGVFVLLPVMVNIVLLDACFHFEPGELIQALNLLAGLLYLLFAEYGRLVEFFFRYKNALADSTIIGSPLVKSLLRFSIFLLPLLLIWRLGLPDKYPWLTGRYKVAGLRIDGRPATITSCTDSLPSLVYFDQGNDCVVEYNSQQRRLFGTYQLDSNERRMTIVWRFPKTVHDTLFATLTGITHNNSGNSSGSDPIRGLTLSGHMGNTDLQMQLARR